MRPDPSGLPLPIKSPGLQKGLGLRKPTSHFKNLAGSPMLALMRRTELTDQQWQHLHPCYRLSRVGGAQGLMIERL